MSRRLVIEDAISSEPSSPKSSVDDDVDEEDDLRVKSSRKSNVESSRRLRGKGVEWMNCWRATRVEI